jgi:hypothetical protein
VAENAMKSKSEAILTMGQQIENALVSVRKGTGDPYDIIGHLIDCHRSHVLFQLHYHGCLKRCFPDELREKLVGSKEVFSG